MRGRERELEDMGFLSRVDQESRKEEIKKESKKNSIDLERIIKSSLPEDIGPRISHGFAYTPTDRIP